MKSTNDGRKTLVTGASGFVGKSVCKYLIENGKEVVAIDIAPSEVSELRVIQCDLTQPTQLYEVVANSDISEIVHCGGLSGPMLAWNTPSAMFRANIESTFNLLEIARISKFQKFIYCSSTTVYGDTSSLSVVPENTALNPSNMYSASKAASEQLVSAYRKQYNLDGISLRLSWVYGPGRRTESAMRTMIMNAISGAKTELPYGSDFYREHIYIDDAVNAIVAALQSNNTSRNCYNVTGGTYVTISQVADIIKRIIPGVDISLASGADAVDDKQAQCDISAAKRDLEYSPAVSLEDGIAEYIHWARNNG